MIIHIPSIFQLPVGGTSNDTTAVQAVFDACAAAGGGKIIGVPGSTYTCGTISVGSNTDIVAPDSTFKQKTAGSNLFDLNGVSRIHFDRVNLLGTAAPGGGISETASSNNGIYIRGNSGRIFVTRSDIREFLYYPVYAEQSKNIWVDENYLFENALGPRFRGASSIFVKNNRIDRTCLYTLTPTADQFSIAIGFDSTDGHSLGICSDAEVTGNIISGHPYAQGVLVHAGTGIIISGNRVNGCSIGISANPFNATDTVSDLTISGNIIEGTAATLPAGNGDSGITVQAGGDTTNIFGVSISGNSVHGANRKILSTSLGGYQIGFTNYLSMTGNVSYGCGANGFVFASIEEGACIGGGNIASTVTAVGTTQNGFNWLGSPRATMTGNMATNINGTNGVGYNVVGSDSDLFYKDSGGHLLNGVYDCTTASA